MNEETAINSEAKEAFEKAEKSAKEVQVRKFMIPCDFQGQRTTVPVYLGSCEPEHHPMHFQREWFSKERGGTFPEKIIESMTKIKAIADKNGVSFIELFEYALQSSKSSIDDADKPISETEPI